MKLLSSFKSSKIGQVLDELRKSQSHPYRILRRNPSNGTSISDMFIGRNGEFETVFLAENTLALTVGKQLPVEHKFTYFDELGQIIKIETCESNAFMATHQMATDVPNIYSFTHHTSYRDEYLQKIHSDLRVLCRQHRGYTGFKFLEQPLHNFVHGNWGAIYCSDRGSLRSLSTQRSMHTYTIQEFFQDKFEYDILIQNPTEKTLNVRVAGTDNYGNQQTTEEFQIQKFGFRLFQPEDLQPIYSLSSNFPVLRPYIFEISRSSRTCNVFHA